MNKINLEINDKLYKVKVVETSEEAETGLMGVKSLPTNEGMLFPYDEEDEVAFWMKDTLIPLDIIFIDEDWTVTRVTLGKPMDETPITGIASYVLELNINSGIKIGDEIEIDDEDEDILLGVKKTTMRVIGSDGNVQMELEGGERIFSRKNTKTMIRLAKRAYKLKSDSDFKILGRKVLKYLDTQDSNTPEYVELP